MSKTAEEIKICTGCGHPSNVKIKPPALGCCPDNNYLTMEEYAQAYHTAKLEEVSELPSDDIEINNSAKILYKDFPVQMEVQSVTHQRISRFVFAFNIGAKWIRSIAQSVIAKKDAEISTLKAEIGKYAEVYGKTSHELQQAKAEIERLKGDNIEYRGEAEPTCESCIFFTADNDVPPCSICKFCDSGAKESMHQPIKK